MTGFNIPWRAAFINANGVDDFELSGEGTIDGSGMQWGRSYWTAAGGILADYSLGTPGAKQPKKSGVEHTPPPDPQFKVPRPTLVNIQNARRILVRDVLLKDAGYWPLLLYRCDGAVVRAPHAPVPAASSDGTDIDCSHNLLIEGCDIINNDDGICLKGGTHHQRRRLPPKISSPKVSAPRTAPLF